MNRRKNFVSILAGIMAAVLLLTLVLGLLPGKASATSSSEIRKQINKLKEEKEGLKDKIAEVQKQYQQNEDEILDIIAKKNVIEQEIQLLHTQIDNINQQIKGYNILIADKQDELDVAEDWYEILDEENKERIRTMEENGQLSYWDVLFRANSFSDLLDRLNIIEEIAASDRRRLQELGDAADAVQSAQNELWTEKKGLEEAKDELDSTKVELDTKQSQALDLFQQLLEKADDLEALEAEYEAQEEEFLTLIAQKELEYDEAREAEWLAYMATYVPPTTAPPSVPMGGDGDSGNYGDNNVDNNSGGSSTPQVNTGGGWVVPVHYTSITSPFGYRVAPTTGASSYHQGVDLDTGTGDPVVAAKAGIVTVAGFGKAAGNYVSINHQDGFGSIYMHLSSYCVSAGQIVSAGQLIGYTGATGVVTGDHLHFGVTYNGVYVNPCNYVPLY